MNHVREKRKEKKLSLRQLAMTTRIDVADLSRVERGLVPVFPSWKSRISDALGVSKPVLFPEFISVKC